jgi:hypothetical protein
MIDSRSAVRTEIAAAFALTAAALFALFWLIPNNIEPARSELDISPAFFPVLTAGLVLFLSLVMLVARLTRAVVATAELSGPAILSEVVVWCGASVAIWFALPVIGFIPTSIAVVILVGLATGYQKWWVLGAMAILFSITVDFGAWQVFTVDLP